MKKLPLIHKANGYIYTQLMRTKNKALYESDCDFYEVFRIKIRPAEEAFGRKYPERETYPGNEDFGKFAWCYQKYEYALRKYNKL